MLVTCVDAYILMPGPIESEILIEGLDWVGDGLTFRQQLNGLRP